MKKPAIALQGNNPELDHIQADRILIEFLRQCGHPAVAEAWERASERVGFWYA